MKPLANVTGGTTNQKSVGSLASELIDTGVGQVKRMLLPLPVITQVGSPSIIGVTLASPAMASLPLFVKVMEETEVLLPYKRTRK